MSENFTPSMRSLRHNTSQACLLASGTLSTNSFGNAMSVMRSVQELEAAMQRARASDRTYLICIDTDAARTTDEGGWWWEVAVPEVSPREGVRSARADYEAHMNARGRNNE